MDEDTLRDILQEYFSEDFKITSFVKNEKECTANINCNIVSSDGVNSFVQYYTKETNETLKLKLKRKETEKSIYKVKAIYRCHQDTRYERTRDTRAVLEQNPLKRFRNTSCQFQMYFKVRKAAINGFSCYIVLVHRHNHPVNSLEALSFIMPSDEVRKEINSLFSTGLTPS